MLYVLLFSLFTFDMREQESSSRPVKGAFRELKAEELERVVVEWGKVVMDKEEPWTPLSISGRVMIKSEDRKASIPMDWVQPITVVIVKRHENHPDWSKGYEYENSKGIDVTTETNGRFIARLHPADIHRQIGITKPYQVGISLGKRDGDKATWTSSTPVLKQTIGTIDIPGPEALSKTLQLINAVPSPIGWEYDPAAVVRAANHLRSLGKEKAVAALRAYMAIAHGPDTGGFVSPIPENIDTSNQWCLAVLVPLVFENKEHPHPQLRGTGRITIEGDIPFHNIRIEGFSGSLPSMTPLVEWAEKRGKIIVKQLRPPDRPLEAAEKLSAQLSEREKGEIGKERLREHLQVQAWRMVAHVTNTPRPTRGTLVDHWQDLKDLVDWKKIRWDEGKQEYVRGK